VATKIRNADISETFQTLVVNPDRGPKKKMKKTGSSRPKRRASKKTGSRAVPALRGSAERKTMARRKKRTTKRRRNLLMKRKSSKRRKPLKRRSTRRRRNYGKEIPPRGPDDRRRRRRSLKSKARRIRRRPAMSRRRNMLRLRNKGSSYLKKAKGIGLSAARVGAGFVAGLGVGEFVGRTVQHDAGALAGNALAVAGFEIAYSKVPFVAKNDPKHLMAVGAGLSFLYNAVGMLSSRGIIPQSIAQYLPGAVSPVIAPIPDMDMVVSPEGTGAYVEQAALYGMGGSPLESSLQHQLNMVEGGMAGGIFDSKTTLGEYDVLDTAPEGTNVQAALADYEVWPPTMGSVDVRAATAGLGANVEEAFAGVPIPGTLKEYVAVPLSDYVPVGDGQVGPVMNPSTLEQIQDAARAVTVQRIRSGKPVDGIFQANLMRAAEKVAAGGKEIPHAPTQYPLTRSGAPFPGAGVPHRGAIAGQPAVIEDYLDDQDGGIFS